MNKISCIVSCPIDCYSGYSKRSIDFVKELIIAKPDWDIKILSQRWGNTRFGYLADHNETDLISRIIPKLTSQPDVWVQITVPNEFAKVGKYNIGVTAGIETTLCDATWIQGCNNMDLVLVSSNHAKETFERSIFDKKDTNTGQTLSQLKLDTKMEVLFEGLDTELYKPSVSSLDLSSIPESYLFLTLGHWLQGDFGEDRKNIGYTIKSFLETFKNTKNAPGLLLKVQAGAGTSIMDREAVLDKIDAIRKTVKGELPNIYLLHGEMSDEEVVSLYNHPKVKAMVSLAKGEGFGRPLLEFSMVNRPIIATKWSGQVDYLQEGFVKFVGGEVQQIHPSAVVDKMLIPESGWFRPNDIEVGKAFKDVFLNYDKWTNQAKRQGYHSRTNFSKEKMRELLGTILDKNMPIIPKQMEFKLPKLTKI